MEFIALITIEKPDTISSQIIYNEISSDFLTEVNRMGFMEFSSETAEIHLRIK
jgi:hypothetical protein